MPEFITIEKEKKRGELNAHERRIGSDFDRDDCFVMWIDDLGYPNVVDGCGEPQTDTMVVLNRSELTELRNQIDEVLNAAPEPIHQ